MNEAEIAKLLGSSQSGGQSFFETPKFLQNITMYFEVKTNENTPCFQYYDKESKTNKFYAKPIDGILIGSANMLTSFSNRLGANGASIKSTIFFEKNKKTGKYEDAISLYGVGKKLFTGSVEDAESYIISQGGVVKKRKILYILSGKGIYSISTNVSLAYNELKRNGNELRTNIIRLTPTIYSTSDVDISDDTKKVLSGLAKKNPPAYVKINPVEKITVDEAEAYGLVEVVGMYNEMVDYYKSLRGKNVESSEEQEDEPDWEMPDEPHGGQPATPPEAPSMPNEDDLPF